MFFLLIDQATNKIQFSSVQSSRSVMSNSVTPWTSARQASLSIPNSRNLLKLKSIELVMPSNHLILCRPHLLEDIYSFSLYKSRGKEQIIQHTAKLESKMFPFSLSGPFLHYQIQGPLFFLILESCTLPTSHEKMTLFPLKFLWSVFFPPLPIVCTFQKCVKICHSILMASAVFSYYPFHE